MGLLEIASGWYHYTKGSEQTRRVMKERLSVCATCPNREELSPVGKVLVTLVNDINNIHRCGLCKCPLGALASVPEMGCKEKRWRR